ncbi:MAG: ribokinase [Pseudomonadota bacterium]
MAKRLVILGVFVADTSYRAARPPRMGETILGERFALGPGGKGSNQAVAAARLGADVHFISKLGCDPFADMADKIWAEAGVKPAVTRHEDSYTGAAYIFIEDSTGNNAIIICPGVAATISANDIENQAGLIKGAGAFMTQLEQPIEACQRGLEIAHHAGVTTILNPAPAMSLPDGVLSLCDYLTPNETEAQELSHLAVTDLDSARKAADKLLAKGPKGVIVTLGPLGALYHTASQSVHVPAIDAGPVVETTGAGDCFNGAFATALMQGQDPLAATRFGCAASGISVTRPGTAPSMPSVQEVRTLLRAG